MQSEGIRILVVEDDPDGQQVVATVLHHLNYEMDVANNATEAEELLFNSGWTYHAAIIDLALPDKDGWELLAEILESPTTADLFCIAVTAYHTSKLREEAMQRGFRAYFSKPLDANHFARSLQEIL